MNLISGLNNTVLENLGFVYKRDSDVHHKKRYILTMVNNVKNM